MIDNYLDKPKQFIKDLADFNENDTSIHLPANAKNIERLKDLNIQNIWLIGANDKELKKILPLLNVKYLNLYQILATDLSILETQSRPETMILNWNTKSIKLWDFSKNINLKTLEIIDFSKISDIDEIKQAKQIVSLTLGGGHDKALKIKTLQPISDLINLKYLGLTNLKVEDDSLKPLATLKNLDNLEISNQFDTREYAWLASRLINTKCKMFNASNPCHIVDANGKLVWDTMITGKRKPFLNSIKDKSKIDKYINDFEQLKNELK